MIFGLAGALCPSRAAAKIVSGAVATNAASKRSREKKKLFMGCTEQITSRAEAWEVEFFATAKNAGRQFPGPGGSGFSGNAVEEKPARPPSGRTFSRYADLPTSTGFARFAYRDKTPGRERIYFFCFSARAFGAAGSCSTCPCARSRARRIGYGRSCTATSRLAARAAATPAP